MTLIFTTALLAFFKLFPILNPPAMAPVFQEITQGVPDRIRNRIAFAISCYTMYLLASLLLVGGWMLKILGVSIDVIGISGGILLFHTAWGMLNRGDRLTSSEQAEIKSMSGKVFFPLTMPMTAGPGAIAVTLSMVPEGQFFAKSTIFEVIGINIGIGLAATTVWIFYRFSGAFLSRLGNTAKATIGQISAFILLAIGVQLIWTSLSNLIRTL
ncbi:MAG: MarC family protein [Holophagaceae bacterium]|nr:MarC family protein [Holophagaceae bacterium]